MYNVVAYLLTPRVREALGLLHKRQEIGVFNLMSKTEHNRRMTIKNMQMRLMERRLCSQRAELRRLHKMYEDLKVLRKDVQN